MLQYWGNSYGFAAVTNPSALLLLHGDGSNGSTAIIDSSSYARTPTITGATQISTTIVKSGFQQAIWVPNSSSQLGYSLGSEANFGTGNFTIEYFVYPTHAASVLGRYVTLVGGTYPSSNYRDVTFRQGGSGYELFYIVGSTVSTANGGTVSRNAWQHHAIVRNDTTLTAYVNGVAMAALSAGSNVFNFSSLTIAPSFESGNGYYDEVRISNSAIYTANFSGSIPTAPFTS